jgi:hypothetical protein
MGQLVYRIERGEDRSVVLRRGPFPGRAGPALIGLAAAGVAVVSTPLVLGAGLLVKWLSGSDWLLEHGTLAAIASLGGMGGLYTYMRHFRRPRQIVFDWLREELSFGRRTPPIPFEELASISVAEGWVNEDDSTLYDVVAHAKGQAVIVGEFETREEAEEWAAELREHVGMPLSGDAH